MEKALQLLNVVLPFFLFAWIFLIWNTIRNPQRLRNGFALLNALLWTIILIACIFGENMGLALFFLILLVMIVLLIVPFFLLWNGIVMINKEGFSIPNILSFVLGIGIMIGEYTFLSSMLVNYEADTITKLDLITPYIGLSALYFCLIILAFVLYSIFVQILPYKKNLDCLIIHGCGLKEDGTPSKILQERIDKAIKVYHACNDNPYIICSGGKGEDEIISEAESMKNYLLKNGIRQSSLIMENKSTTTWENLVYSKRIIEERDFQHIALITSNYHVYRVLVYASQLQMKCVGIGSHVAFYYWPSALLRECIAIYSKPKKLLLIIGIWVVFTILFWM